MRKVSHAGSVTQEFFAFEQGSESQRLLDQCSVLAGQIVLFCSPGLAEIVNREKNSCFFEKLSNTGNP